MKIYLRDQKKNFDKHLEILKRVLVQKYERPRLKEQISSIVILTQKRLDELNLDFFFNYQIFPETILTFYTQWQIEGRKLKVGDTIVQQVTIPPIKTLSQKMIFGVRINEIIDQPNKQGYSYETLHGHVEKGVSIFTLEQLDEQLIFKIHTFSTPGNFLTKLVGPFFSVPYQAFCTKAALKNVKYQLENQ